MDFNYWKHWLWNQWNQNRRQPALGMRVLVLGQRVWDQPEPRPDIYPRLLSPSVSQCAAVSLVAQDSHYSASAFRSEVGPALQDHLFLQGQHNRSWPQCHTHHETVEPPLVTCRKTSKLLKPFFCELFYTEEGWEENTYFYMKRGNQIPLRRLTLGNERNPSLLSPSLNPYQSNYVWFSSLLCCNAIFYIVWHDKWNCRPGPCTTILNLLHGTGKKYYNWVKISIGWYMGMSWLLWVSLHVLSSQQIMKEERSYPQSNKAGSTTTPEQMGPGCCLIQQLLSILYFQVVSDSDDCTPTAGKVWEVDADPSMEGRCFPSSKHYSRSSLWYAQKGVYVGLNFRDQELGFFSSSSLPALLLSHEGSKYPFLLRI